MGIYLGIYEHHIPLVTHRQEMPGRDKVGASRWLGSVKFFLCKPEDPTSTSGTHFKQLAYSCAAAATELGRQRQETPFGSLVNQSKQISECQVQEQTASKK